MNSDPLYWMLSLPDEQRWWVSIPFCGNQQTKHRELLCTVSPTPVNQRSITHSHHRSHFSRAESVLRTDIAILYIQYYVQNECQYEEYDSSLKYIHGLRNIQTVKNWMKYIFSIYLSICSLDTNQFLGQKRRVRFFFFSNHDLKKLFHNTKKKKIYSYHSY